MSPMSPFHRAIQSRNLPNPQKYQLPPNPLPPTKTPSYSFASSSSAIYDISKSDYSNIPKTESTEYIKAWKCCNYVDWYLKRFQGLFHGIYNLDDQAVCEVWKYHPAPDVNCVCGFYGVKEKDRALLDYNAEFYMEVEFYGKVIVCERGYRAQKQRILGLYLTDECFIKEAKLFDFEELKSDHIILAEMSNKLGIEVRKVEDMP